MIRTPVFALIFAAVAHAGFACETVPDVSSSADPLLERLQTAESAHTAALITNELWAVWTDAPDETAQELLTEGVQRRAVQDLDGALVAFEALIAYCPGYAEGYHQRGFVRFIRGDYPGALADMNLSLERSPRHIASLTGKALTLMQMGQYQAAHDTLSAAVALNPWLPERRFLQELANQIDQAEPQEL